MELDDMLSYMIPLKIKKGLERWLSSQEQLLFSGDLASVPTATWWLKTICNSNCRRSDTFF